MAIKSNKKKQKPSSSSRVAAIAILILILVLITTYFIILPNHKAVVISQKGQITDVKPAVSIPSLPTTPTTTITPPSPQTSEDNQDSEYPPVVVTPKKPVIGNITKAKLAIIIDDMGGSLSEARSLVAIKVPLTFSLIPGLRFDKKISEYASEQHIETMIHIPMQSKGWPRQRLEANGLLVSMSSDEIEQRVSAFLERFPIAVGVNNHMGSEFTAEEEKMTTVLQMLKNNNLFFIDSVTSPTSKGIEVAEKIGIKSAKRNVFLDNKQERSYITGQINQAVKIAIKNGSAIAICHPHVATITTLAAVLPGLAKRGVELVPVSQLVK